MFASLISHRPRTPGLLLILGMMVGWMSPPELLAQSPVPNLSRRDAVVAAVEAVGPAVVSISTEQVVRGGPFGGSSRSLFDFFQGLEPSERLERASLGTGVIIDAQGRILTNEHVIRGAARVTATLTDDREVECEVIGSDPDNDLAVLQLVKPGPIKAARLGTSRDLLIGETVIAIGNPYGFSQTVTTGVVSANYRSFKVDNRVYRNFIQTDAAINPGNSGGPLLNILGEVIGINTAIYGNAQGLGFAIPIDKARRVVADLIQFGERQAAWIGLEVEEDPQGQASRARRRPDMLPVVVTSVYPDSPAARAGLKRGDRIVTLDRGKVTGLDDYIATLRQLGAGDELSVTVERGQGVQTVLKVKSTGFPDALLEALIDQRLGIKVEALNQNLARQYQLTTAEGLLITEVRRTGALGAIGVAPGDVIRKGNGIPTLTEKDLKEALIRGFDRKGIVILLQRGRMAYNIPVQF